ncbi:S1 RNA-binding domain-containing protein [Pseudoalteromonas amylolytica]|uniref:GntR family transcriptional regulator n=1 Tax=Pseudoalteromonas amylolytica TaxID=1859457 RepID=A0A1S1MWV5_9GAMM|nr:GntR family transcriptional regulator [Pseudoalteromonas sp. JW3]OHU91368.1 GntR family transcriptional regulator [Pseudoalteromonas amylolytica]
MLGSINSLMISEVCAEGAYLDGKELGEVFLPAQELEEHLEAGDSVQVFIFQDAQGHPTATTKTPIAQVGQFALLRVKALSTVGAFMDIGIDKDVLAPFNEQKPKMREGHSYLVRLYLDNASKRLCASSNLNKFLNKTEPNYSKFEKVDLIVAAKTDLGYKVIINEQHFGVVFFNTVFKRMFMGQKLKGYIKSVREDGKIDVVLEKPGMGKVVDLGAQILQALNDNGGYLPLGDKSDPEQIKKTFATSKANYKKAIGGLFKQGKINIEAKSISLKK